MNASVAQIPLPFAPVVARHPAPWIDAPSNAAACAWLGRTAEWPQLRLALWGPPASGKSRLLQAWADRHGASIEQGALLRFHPPHAPIEAPLAIDDANTAPPHALLHILNAAREAGHPVLLAAPAAPARWAVTLADLASRLRAAVAVPIGPPEDSLLRALLARHFAARQLRVPEATQHWLLVRLPRTHAALRDAVIRLDRAAQCDGTPISPALARITLPDLLADLDPEIADPPAEEVFVSACPFSRHLL